MVQAAPVHSFAEYLAFEAKSETKHELVNGRILAMFGGTIEHARIATRFVRVLGIALGDRPCEVYGSNARVRVVATGRATYPDVTVVCGPVVRDREDRDGITNPIVLVEVLSESTEASDRGQKFAHYRCIPSLRHYVLVSQNEQRIEWFTPGDDGSWVMREARAGGAVVLDAIGGRLSVDAIYADPTGVRPSA